ncbi:50S ribosomal protein L35 [Candidatus Neptunochlamydia vexilliferae]|uniref:Large ribosomal subunit protein bL35 n=2 Tax=Candidatus Neptunichlamydia vexilliferae TaxID=1651774 RepID=A0ABS0AX28_9BACT|nr:50S ribosomal protein L35 [Candidatus Neptunochlamydia vexilliferae]MBF5058676.1 50S ribosomal protein L35 [Candidatus Neptunochlamydia vexilliferae]
MKTKKAIRNRFKKTGTGKIMRTKQGRRHILTKKTSKKKRQLKKQTVMSESYAKKYKRLACM